MKNKKWSGGRLRKQRMEAGYSIADVTFELRKRGHKASTLTLLNWEHGYTKPSISGLQALAALYKVSIDLLVA